MAVSCALYAFEIAASVSVASGYGASSVSLRSLKHEKGIRKELALL